MIVANVENLLFLLLVAVAVLFQFLAKTAGKAGKDQTKRTSTPSTPPLIPSVTREPDDERIRKLLEALGQPPTSKPPPPVVPRTAVPPRPLAPVRPPMSPLSQIRRLGKREATPKEIPSFMVTRAEKIVSPKLTDAPAFEVHEGLSPISPPPTVRPVAGLTKAVKTDEFRTGIAILLASTSGLRDAIILREILGPPRGLRPIDSR
jgi:hypothetical protein